MYKNGGNVIKNNSNKKIIEPCLYSCNSVITDANQEFLEFTGFIMAEVLGKSLINIGATIRINKQILLDNISGKYTGYIFTKLLEAREVNISMSYGKEAEEKTYTFVEEPNSRLDDKLIFEKQTLLDNIVGVAIYSVPDLIMLKVNQKYLDFHDSPYNEEETSIGLSIREIVTGYVGTESDTITRTVLETQKSSYRKEIKYERFERGITYWDTTRTPIFEGGKIKYMLLTTSDSTERVLKNQRIERQHKVIEQQKEQLERQKEQLKQKNTQLVGILENLSEAVVLTDNEGKYVMRNKEARQLIYRSEALTELGDSFNTTQYFDMEGNRMLFENLPGIRALRGEIVKNVKMHVINPEKDYFINNSAIPIYNTNGDLTTVVSCFHDVTETIEKSKKIEQQNKDLETIIENMPDAFLIYNKQGELTHFNSEARKLYPEINSLNTNDNLYNGFLYCDLDNNIIPIENVPIVRAFSGEKIRNERIVIKRAARLQITEINATPIFDDNKDLVSVVMSHRDISEAITNEMHIKNQQELLLIAEKEKNEALKREMEMKDEFLSLISHEFRTPLTVINSAIQVMELICKNELSDKAKGLLNKIRQNSNRQLKLVNNLLDITRMNAGHLKINKTNIDIVLFTRSITESIAIFAEQKCIKLSFFSPLKKIIMGVDDEKYERILLNLLSNAIKFTPENQSVTVRISRRMVQGKCMVGIQVRDKGVGIPDDKKELIFERFGQVDNSLTRQAEGTGIGLHLVKMFVEVMGGEITLESEVGKGSMFTILLPIEKAKEASIEQMPQDISNQRLIRAKAIEFSDIYF